VATICSQDNLCNDFDATVNYLRSLVTTIDQDTHNVSQMDTKSVQGKKPVQVSSV
jgi:hypothetical protein